MASFVHMCTHSMPGSSIPYDFSLFTNENEPWAGSGTPLCDFVNICHLPGGSGDGSLAFPHCLGTQPAVLCGPSTLSPLAWKDGKGCRCWWLHWPLTHL